MLCPKCKEDKGMPGFCPECYRKVYAFTDKDIQLISVNSIYAYANHMELARDDGYGGLVMQSMNEIGMKNPLIIAQRPNDYLLLIGHHRFNYILKNNIELVPAVVIKKKIYGRFTEGSSNWLYIGRLNNKLLFNVCRLRDVVVVLEGMGKAHKNNEDKCPKYSDLEIEIFYLGD